jgi:hypothetical protein
MPRNDRPENAETEELVRNPFHNFYAQMPYLARRELTPFEYMLYGYYIEESGLKRRRVGAPERETYTACNMSKQAFLNARDGLVDKGFIRIVQHGTPNTPGVKGTPTIIELTDVWVRNFKAFASPEQLAEMFGDPPPAPKPENNPPSDPPNGSNPPNEVKGSDVTPSDNGNPPNEVKGSDVTPSDNGNPPNEVKGSDVTPNELDVTPNGSDVTPNGSDVTRFLESLESLDSETPSNAEIGIGTAEEKRRARKDYIQSQYDQVKNELLNPKPAYTGKSRETFEYNAELVASIIQHPLVKLFCEKTGVVVPTKTMCKLLSETFTTTNLDGARVTYPGGLMRLWEKTPGFEAFARVRIEQLAKIGTVPVDILKHLCNLYKVDGKLVGFHAWAKDNAGVIAANTISTKPREIIAPNVEDRPDLKPLF